MQKYLLFRDRDAGDFISYEHMCAVFDAVAARPWVQAYGYTKCIKWFVRAHREGRIPSNYALVQSEGGLQDKYIDRKLPHSKVFPTHLARMAAGYVDGTESDIPAIKGATHVGLVYHGSETIEVVDDMRNFDQRGGATQVSPGVWEVAMPGGHKRRRTYTHTFELSEYSNDDLAAVVAIKTGNAKVKKTAQKLGLPRAAATSLPALTTCAFAGDCSGFCYAMQGRFNMPTHVAKRAKLLAVYREAMARGILADLIGQQLDTAVGVRLFAKVAA